MYERNQLDVTQLNKNGEGAHTPIEIRSKDGELTLRQLTALDAQELFDLIDRNRDHFSQFGEKISNNYQTVESVLESISNPKNPNRLRFGMRDKEGRLMGSISLALLSSRNIGEVGYYIGREFSGRGVTTSATNLITEYGFSSLGLVGTFARVAEGNTPSQRVLEKAGFKKILEYPVNRTENQILWGKYNLNYKDAGSMQR